MVILALTTVILMALTGLSIDIANLFIKKTRLRIAVDAGSIAGITSLVARISQTGNDVLGMATAEAASNEMVAYNLKQMGIAASDIKEIISTAAVDSASREMTLTVNASINVKTLFMGLIRSPNPSSTINAQSVAKRNPALISLVLDSSGSMSGTKIADLKTAAGAFVDTFLENVDQMAVIKFNYKGTVIHPMDVIRQSGANSKATIKNQINALSAADDTNIAEGLQIGRTQIENAVNNAQNAVKAIVIMTDGAPTTIRGHFLKPRATKPSGAPTTWQPLGQNPAGSGLYDYYAQTDSDDNVLNKDAGNVLPPPTEHCSDHLPNAPIGIANCLNDYSYLDSKGVQRGKDDAGSTITNLSNSGQSEIEKEAYDLAAIEAGYAKNSKIAANPTDTGITIYAIGLGVESGNKIDPYQDVNDTGTIKSILLRKIANDPLSSGDPAFPGQNKFESSQPSGLYLQTPDSSKLTSLFLTIARRIQIRLVK